MIYNFTVTSSLGGVAATPTKTQLKLTRGVIHKLDILFPPGCLGLVGLAIHTALHQVWPTNPGECFTSDAETISFREHFPILFEPFDLEAWHYNLDDTYDHKIIIRIGILPLQILAPWLLPYDERVRVALGNE